MFTLLLPLLILAPPPPPDCTTQLRLPVPSVLKTYALVPIDSDNYSYNKWALVDDQGKTYKTLTGKSTLNGNTIEGGYVDIDRTKQRIFGMDDLKMDTSNLKETVSKGLAEFFTNNKSW